MSDGSRCDTAMGSSWARYAINPALIRRSAVTARGGFDWPISVVDAAGHARCDGSLHRPQIARVGKRMYSDSCNGDVLVARSLMPDRAKIARLAVSRRRSRVALRFTCVRIRPNSIATIRCVRDALPAQHRSNPPRSADGTTQGRAAAESHSARRCRSPAAAPPGAAADCGDPGQSGRAAGQAPRRPRPTRHPHPIHLPRHVRRPRRRIRRDGR